VTTIGYFDGITRAPPERFFMFAALMTEKKRLGTGGSIASDRGSNTGHRRQVRKHGDLYILSAQSIIGSALVIIGLTVMIVAQITLWRFYSSTLVIREDHQLITHGVYRFARHPIYLGAIMVVCIGVPVFASSLYGLLTMSTLIPIILNRIRMEERMLTEEFGDAYRTYKETTRKLIPFIY
jgi:protein-S-isoprenylcysteine O-methyltransferase Ste14